MSKWLKGHLLLLCRILTADILKWRESGLRVADWLLQYRSAAPKRESAKKVFKVIKVSKVLKVLKDPKLLYYWWLGRFWERRRYMRSVKPPSFMKSSLRRCSCLYSK